MVKTYEKDLDEVNSANSEYHANVTNSKHFAPWITVKSIDYVFVQSLWIGLMFILSGTRQLWWQHTS
jgi:hypothetical protein